MEPDQIYMVNSIFGWVLVALSVIGYILTARRMGERWAGWLVLAAGWALFALAQTLSLTGTTALDLRLLIALWVSSFVLVLTAILLLFLKLIRLRGGP
jgi:hypothetical protein